MFAVATSICLPNAADQTAAASGSSVQSASAVGAPAGSSAIRSVGEARATPPFSPESGLPAAFAPINACTSPLPSPSWLTTAPERSLNATSRSDG